MNQSLSRRSGTRGRARARWAVALVVAVGAIGIGLGVARTGSSTVGDRACGQDWAVERLPADVQVVVRLSDADRQRKSGPGRALARAVLEARLFAETKAAWLNLAQRLELAPDEAFARLAGRRVVLAIAGPAPDGARAWAILSDVDPDVERSLRGELHLAPRQAIAGQPVLSLEDGRFELAVFCPVDRRTRKASATTRTLVLAPAGRGDLLERIVKGLAGADAGPRLADTPAMIQARRLPQGDVFVLASRHGPDGPEHIALSASLAPDGWSASLLASPGMVVGTGGRELAGARKVAPWSASAIGELAPQAVALVMSEGLPGLDRWAPLLMVPTLPEAADRLRGLLGQRTFLGIFRGHRADAAGPVPGVALALGFESPDVGALAAPADAVMGRLIGALEAGAGAGERDRPDFEGFLPKAPRVVPLSGPAAAIWKPVLGPSPILTWIYRPSQEHPGQQKAQPGWWLVTLAPGDDGSSLATPAWAAGVCERLARPGPAADERPRVSVGSIRVAELVRWLDGVHADPSGSLAPLRCIDTLAWDAWLAPDGAVEGTLRLITGAGP